MANRGTLDDDDLHSLFEQRRELMAAEALESDLDLAFQLQLQEALVASLALQPSTSNSSSSLLSVIPEPQQVTKNDGVSNFATLQSDELTKLEQEAKDREQSEAEMRKTIEDLNRRIHDQRVAREILRIPEEDWIEWGDDYEKPFGEGSSSNSKTAVDENVDVFRLYFKGLVSEERVRNQKIVLAGIGVAICDPRDNLIFEVSKPLFGNGMSKNAAEAKALIEALNAAVALGLKRITYFCDSYPLYQFVNGRWPPKQRKIAMLVNQATLLERKFRFCNRKLVARNDVKFAFKLARDAIVSQITRTAESSCGKNLNENCVICLEDTDVSQMFSVDGCLHRFCFSCMRQHVEVKLLHGMVPKCPHEACTTELVVESCRKFLTPKSIETMRQRIREASIPVADKVYCPNPRCSVLMSKKDVLEYSKDVLGDVERSGARKCVKCHGLFCMDCKVPWHRNMTCLDYKRLNPNPPAEDVKLKSLASRNLWRQCVKCNYMIELAEGCYHMTCRCGFEFCYNCGAEWKNKNATCNCPRWDEDNIWFDHNTDFDEDEEEDEDDEYDDSDSDYY